MAGPPDHPQRTRQLIALSLEDPRQLQQGRVADRVIADADIPAIEMPVHQHEALRLLIAADDGVDAGAFHPALAQLRMQRHLGVPGGDLREQRLAVALVDGQHRRTGLAAVIIQVRRAPDRRADPPVDVLPRVEVNLTDRAALLEERNRRRAAETFDYYDLSRHIDILRRRDEIEEVRRRGWR